MNECASNLCLKIDLTINGLSLLRPHKNNTIILLLPKNKEIGVGDLKEFMVLVFYS